MFYFLLGEEGGGGFVIKRLQYAAETDSALFLTTVTTAAFSLLPTRNTL